MQMLVELKWAGVTFVTGPPRIYDHKYRSVAKSLHSFMEAFVRMLRLGLKNDWTQCLLRTRGVMLFTMR